MEKEIYKKRCILVGICFGFALFLIYWYASYLKNVWVFVALSFSLFTFLGYRHLLKSIEEKNFLAGFKIIKPLVIPKDKIPVCDDIYLGEGFKWETRHAQYVYDKMKDDISKSLAQIKDDVLGGVNFHAIERNKIDIFIPKVEFSGHCCIVATTRAGKTTLLRSIVVQLIRSKEPVVIIDPKGEHFLLNTAFEETKKTYGSTKPFVFISSSFPLITDTFNPFKTFVNISDVGDRVASVLPQTGDSAPFVSYSFYMVDVIARCLIYLGEEITLSSLKRYSLSPSEWKILGWKVFQKFFSENNLPVFKKPDGKEKEKEEQDESGYTLMDYRYSYYIHRGKGYFNQVIDNLVSILEQPKEHLQKMTSSLIPFFSLLSSDEKTLIFAPDNPSFEWEDIKEKKVVYFFFSSLEAVKTVTCP